MPVLPALLAPSPNDSERFVRLLTELFAEQLALTPDAAYLASHARPAVVTGHVASFRWYRRFLPATGAVLDWGCNHAPDSCLLRAWAGDRYDLHACDFGTPERFAAFHDYARLAYSRLTDHVRLPYGDERFDVVIASGVLEHAVMDYESLKELHRVLKPGGTLIITYLPNRWSWEEWVQRVVRKRDYHRRRYGLTETRRMFAHTGFEVIEGRHQAGLRSGPLGRAVRALVPIRLVSATLCFAARKLTCM